MVTHPNFPGPTFIQGPTFIIFAKSRVRNKFVPTNIFDIPASM
jgi:hypothetical protein